MTPASPKIKTSARVSPHRVADSLCQVPVPA
jgi:hypothetical protein